METRQSDPLRNSGTTKSEGAQSHGVASQGTVVLDEPESRVLNQDSVNDNIRLENKSTKDQDVDSQRSLRGQSADQGELDPGADNQHVHVQPLTSAIKTLPAIRKDRPPTRILWRSIEDISREPLNFQVFLAKCLSQDAGTHQARFLQPFFEVRKILPYCI